MRPCLARVSLISLESPRLTRRTPCLSLRSKEVRTNFRGKLKGARDPIALPSCPALTTPPSPLCPGPFNETDRLAAGMTPDFYEDLEGKGYDSDEDFKAQARETAITEEIHPRLT